MFKFFCFVRQTKPKSESLQFTMTWTREKQQIFTLEKLKSGTVAKLLNDSSITTMLWICFPLIISALQKRQSSNYWASELQCFKSFIHGLDKRQTDLLTLWKMNSAHKPEATLTDSLRKHWPQSQRDEKVPGGCKPLLKRNSVISLEHSLRRSSILSSGQPAISANHSEWRGPAWGWGGIERNFLPNPFMPLRPPAVTVKGWSEAGRERESHLQAIKKKSSSCSPRPRRWPWVSEAIQNICSVCQHANALALRLRPCRCGTADLKLLISKL